jgi:hypothetical protein
MEREAWLRAWEFQPLEVRVMLATKKDRGI